MGKRKICPKCGNEKRDSRKQKFERGTVMRMLKMIKVAGIKEKDEETKDFCFGCWKKELRAVVKPFAQELGKTAEDW